MDLRPYVDELQEHLALAAAVGGEDLQDAAKRLSSALDSATRLILLDALSTAAGEISRELLPGSVDVRLRGRDPEFVVERPVAERPVAEQIQQSGTEPAGTELAGTGPADPEPADESPTSRTTLRLSDGLKLRLEQAAAREGSSLNSWIVRALTAAVDAPPRAAPSPAPGTTSGTTSGPAQRSSSFSGWVR